MNPNEYPNLADVEQQHWFYVGKRIIVRHWINRLRPPSRNDLLVDCGAGTGTFASEMTGHCQVLALDDHEKYLALARDKLGLDCVQKGTCVALPLADQSVDVLTALDVIERIKDDWRALSELRA
jgi:ubiquinone/menaquinone biosynthesis C-methylase UbiE